MIRQRYFATVALVIVGLCLPARPARNLGNPPPAQPGYPQELPGARPYSNLTTQATIASVDTTHSDREVVVATQDRNENVLACTGHVYVYNPDGTLRWSAPLPQPPGMGASVADLNGDGVNDIAIGYGEMLTGCMVGGGVAAFDGTDGSPMWSFATHPIAGLGSVYAAPAIGDVNGDGYPEVVFGSWDQCIYMLDRAGNPLWQYANPAGECSNHGHYMYDRVSSTAALADLDADGKLEIVIGSDATTDHFNYLEPKYGGFLNVLRDDGSIMGSWHIDAPLESSPSIADLDGDGVLEIVAGTGEGLTGRGAYVSVWRYDPLASPRITSEWLRSVSGYVRSSPAIGDLNSDGKLDIVAVVPDGSITTESSTVWAWSSDGTELFRRKICNLYGTRAYLHTSPVIADVVGDARPEILLTQNFETIILNADGTYYTDQSTNNCSALPSTTSLTYWANTNLDYIPAVGDIDNSGHHAVVVVGAVDNAANSNHGMLYAWGGHNAGYAPWPQFHRDAAHTGLLDNVPPVNPAGFFVAPPTNTLSITQTITISWSIPGKDVGAGLGGYAIWIDQSPTSLPTTTLNITRGVTIFTSMAGVGTWYAHVRSVDKAGNGSLTTVDLGPFLLYRSQVFIPIAARE